MSPDVLSEILPRSYLPNSTACTGCFRIQRIPGPKRLQVRKSKNLGMPKAKNLRFVYGYYCWCLNNEIPWDLSKKLRALPSENTTLQTFRYIRQTREENSSRLCTPTSLTLRIGRALNFPTFNRLSLWETLLRYLAWDNLFYIRIISPLKICVENRLLRDLIFN